MEEKKHLHGVKKSLCESWTNSFIHEEDLYTPFVHDSQTVLSTQRLLLLSAASELCRSMVSLYKMIVNLGLGHFSQMKNEALQFFESLLIALLKSLIALTLGILHILRLTCQATTFVGSSIFIVLLLPFIYPFILIEELFLDIEEASDGVLIDAAKECHFDFKNFSKDLKLCSERMKDLDKHLDEINDIVKKLEIPLPILQDFYDKEEALHEEQKEITEVLSRLKYPNINDWRVQSSRSLIIYI